MVRERREIGQGRMGISLSSPATPYSLKLSSGLLALSRQDLLNVPDIGYLQIGVILGIILNSKSGYHWHFTMCLLSLQKNIYDVHTQDPIDLD